MKRRHVHILLTALCATLAFAPLVNADWTEGDDYKMHWPQLPDLSPMGIDIKANFPIVLADDFMCMQDGPITSIYVWGSWLNDLVDTNIGFVLSIHSDFPTNEQHFFSKPSNTLWFASFPPGSFSTRLYAPGIAEGWYDPILDLYIPPAADTNCWQYNFPIDPVEAFVQSSGTIYWLDVQAFATNEWGWKTCDPALRWNDDATWTVGEEPNPAGWTNLVYPDAHPLPEETLDMAFVIQGEEHEKQTNTLCPKWIQEPDCEIGLDVMSWKMNDQDMFRVADDWLCDGRPIVGIRWWGSYIGHATNDPNPKLPPPTNSPLRPFGFQIKWYTDTPVSPTNPLYSFPGDVLASNRYPLEDFLDPTNYVWAPGVVYEMTACVSAIDFEDDGTFFYEHEYSYFVRFPATNEWNEKDGRVYWMSIEAVYGTDPTSNHWGWKTTSPQWHWNDDAVWRDMATPWQEMLYPPYNWGWITNHPYEGLSLDLAFELLTDVCPRRCKKWEQPPDMILGTDIYSTYFTNQQAGLAQDVVLADDFISDGRPITDIHWWGSYIQWRTTTLGTEAKPVAAPTGTARVIGFNLSWHTDNGAVSCMPGVPLANVFVDITNCHEMFYGSVTQEWIEPNFYEHEYQYYVDFFDADTGGIDPWLETNETPYWLNIQAVFATNFVPGGGAGHFGWGWKITDKPNGCDSIISTNGGVTWTTNALRAPHPKEGQGFDLAFELTTPDIATNSNTVVTVAFTNSYNAPVNSHYMWTTGYCGCGKQVLQETTNLVTGPWIDLWTNPVPKQANLWKAVPLATQRFYRVMQIP